MNHQQKTLNTPYAFGMPMPGRSYTNENYRFGFNGMEKDDEMKGSGNSLDFGARIYDSRLGRFLSTDSWEYKYAWQTPYAYFKNSPISLIDFKGLGGKDDYFDKKSGKFLGTDTDKDNSKIRLIEKDLYNKIVDEGLTTGKTGDQITQHLQNSATDLKNQNKAIPDEVAKNILNHYYTETDYNLDELQTKSVTLNAHGLANAKYGKLWQLEKGKFEINVNKNRFGKELQNKEDFINLFIHERGGHGVDFLKLEKNGITYSSKLHSIEFEKTATILQVNHDSWAKTSLEFKQNLYSVYGKDLVGFSNHEKYKFFFKYGVKDEK